MRRKQIYEALHPETKQYVAGGKARQKTASDKMSFANDTAKKIGKSKRTIERDLQIAENIDEDVKRELEGTNPLSYVISLNIIRRHLTTGQRSAIGVEILPLLEKEAKKRQQIGKGIDGSGGRGHKKNLTTKSSQGYSDSEQPMTKSSQAVESEKGKSREHAGTAPGKKKSLTTKSSQVNEGESIKQAAKKR